MRKLHEPDEACLPVARSDQPAGASHHAPGEDIISRVSVPALRFDWTDWLPYFEDQDISDEQKRELIETLWRIVVAFVDLGWQLNPKPEMCGEVLDLKAILETADNAEPKEAE
ncbi:hypothetical protein [Mesorhizobium sp. J428]|uniref:hypothetical protein n=1 Tax=Mesorhizobium sp. J428 TaxID=2898440 RepID=UPI00215149A9|nr:hypothetical protein [Mesorhizobium sp. J428]MCR5858261.1 hypothetical protein [Mesorhizobium sp. J428]